MDRRAHSIELVNKLFMINIFLQRVGNRQIVDYGLNQSQFTVLGEIIRRPSLNQKEIIGGLLLEKSNLSKIIKKLGDMELITITIPDDDKRRKILRATDKGKTFWDKCMGELDDMKMLFTAPLKDEELEELLPAVNRLTELVVYHTKKSKGDQ